MSGRRSDKECYKALRGHYLRQCFLNCVRKFTKNDGLSFSIVVDSNVKVPINIPISLSLWLDLTNNTDDKIVVKVYKDESESELIDTVKYVLKDFIGGYDHKTDSSLLVFEKMAGAFKEYYENLLATIPADQWISTGDRFPDDGSRVLTCDSVGWVDIGVYNGRRGWEINGNYLSAEMIKRWQPLPTGERSV